MTPGVGLEGIGMLVLGQIMNFKHKFMYIDLVDRLIMMFILCQTRGRTVDLSINGA